MSLALASLWGTIHNTRLLVRAGLANPADVDEVHGSILEPLEQYSPPGAAP